MTVNYLTFNSKLSTLVSDPQDRRCVAGAVAAQCIAECLPMPTEAVENVENYYLMNIKSVALSKLNPINEAVTLDSKLALEYIRKYWLLRYNTLFPINPALRLNSATYGYFDTIMGVGLFIDQEHHQFVNQYKIQILELYKELHSFFEVE